MAVAPTGVTATTQIYVTDDKRRPTLLANIMKYLIPLVVTVGLCWVMFRSIPFGDMVRVVREQCDWRWIALALGLSILSHVFRAMRWRIQLRALGYNVPLLIMVYSIFGTYAVNLVFPRLGEVWRTGYIAQRQDAPFSEVFGSMVADRLADTLTVLCLLALTFALASTQLVSYLSQNAGLYHTVMGVVCSPWTWIGAIVAVGSAWWLLTRSSGAGTLLGRLQAFARGLWDGFAVIVRMPGKGRWLALTLCIWGCYFTQLYVAFYAFPFTAQTLARHGVIAALVAFTFSSIAMGVPSNGGIGPWQWAIMFALSIYGVDSTDSMAFANLVLGSQTLLLILLGIYTFVAIALGKRRKAVNTTNNTTKQH